MTVIGIDLGNTYAIMAIVEENKAKIIPNLEGERATRCMVSLDPDSGRWLVGTLAKRQAPLNPENTVFSFKRFLGRTCYDTDIQEDKIYMPYLIDTVSNSRDISIKMGEQWYTPPQIYSKILGKLKKDAEAYLGEHVSQAVVTVPGHYNYIHYQALREAAHLAGLEIKRFINASTAVGYAYGQQIYSPQNIVVFSLGSGCLDVSVLEADNNVIEVKAVSGDLHLGGDDFDLGIMRWMCAQFESAYDIDLRQERGALLRLREAAEKAKCELSACKETDIDLPYIVDHNGTKDLHLTLTCDILRQIIIDLSPPILSPLQQALADAQLNMRDIHEVVIAGQQMRMPLIKNTLMKFCKQTPKPGLGLAESAALGAALYAGVLEGKIKNGKVLLDVTPLSLSVTVQEGKAVLCIPRNTMVPVRKSYIFATTKDGQRKMNIKIYQGERLSISENIFLRDISFSDLSPADLAVAKIKVTFDVLASHKFRVFVQDPVTGQEIFVPMEHLPTTSPNAYLATKISSQSIMPKQHKQAKSKPKPRNKRAKRPKIHEILYNKAWYIVAFMVIFVVALYIISWFL